MGEYTNILNSFKVRDELNQDVWDIDSSGNATIKPEIRESLLRVANEFLEYLNLEIFIEDIYLTGSLCNYNLSQYSDFDLHLIVDNQSFPEVTKELYKELFDLKKILFNTDHEIKIKGYTVEVYVQDVNEEHTSDGVFSLLFNEWVSKPSKTTKKLNKNTLVKKVDSWMNKIETIIRLANKEKDLEESLQIIKDFKKKLKEYRKSGLEKGGEFSYENLTFKFLRRNQYIKKLFDLEKKLTTDRLSTEQFIDL
jgi:hypothetical protein